MFFGFRISEKTFSCVVATIVSNCGIDAGRVYRTLLKITRYSDDVCGIEASDGIPSCSEKEQTASENEEKFSEIYYGLMDRIGTIPEQDKESENLISQSGDDLTELSIEAVTEAIEIALDDLDSTAESEVPNTISSDTGVEKIKSYLMSPNIAEIFKGILFYNYSGIEYAAYWRQPEFVVIENITCEHLQPSYMRSVIFRCKVEFRDRDPDCVSDDTIHENLTPELVRDLDPDVPDDCVAEFGPQPEWMKDFDEAYATRLRDQLTYKSLPDVTDTPDILTTSSTLLRIAMTMSTNRKSGNRWEYDVNEQNMNSIFPNDVHNELFELFTPTPDQYVPPPVNRIQVGNTLFFLIYDPFLTNAVENATCSRLDECNPRGKGLWKCKMWRRNVEPCDDCYPTSSANTYDDQTGNHKDSKLNLEVPETEQIHSDEGSGILEDSAEENISLIFSGDDKSEIEAEEIEYPVLVEMHDVDPENTMDNSELHYVDPEYNMENTESAVYELSDTGIKESVEDLELHQVEDNDVQFYAMLDSDTNPESTTQVIYTLDETDADENTESEMIVPDDEHGLTGNILVLNLSDMENDMNKYEIFDTFDRR